MELLIALLISLGSISADQVEALRGNEAMIIEMAEASEVDQARIEDAKAEIIGQEEVDF